MHSFPAWKIWLVAFVTVATFILALPNVFGEAPALQLSRNDRTAVAAADKTAAESALAAKNIPIEQSFIEGDRLVLRFSAVEQQLAARDALQDAVGRDYLVALSQVPRTPAWIRAIGLKPMSLGLDLRG